MFVAVHTGCGWSSDCALIEHRDVCQRACLAGMEALRNGACAIVAVTASIRILEGATCTNAGVGSTLTEAGIAEVIIRRGERLVPWDIKCLLYVSFPVNIDGRTEVVGVELIF